MATLAKIKDVTLYAGFTAGAGDCYKVLQLMKQAGVSVNFLNYSNLEDHHKANFEALSQWTFGNEDTTYGKGLYNKEFTDFPILIWDECWSDFTIVRHAAHGLKEISKCAVLKNPELAK